MSRSQWAWRQAHLGGGGFITSLLRDPFDPDRLYARCDVAGAFVSDDAGRSWEARNAGLSEAHHHQVAGLVPSPHTPGLVLRCSGDNRDDRCHGSVHRSTDHGRTWTHVTDEIGFNGNGPLRAYGEIISWDPFDPDAVLLVSYADGIYRSLDAGRSWTYVSGRGERHSVVRHHPQVRGLVFAGTAGDRVLTGPYSATLSVHEQIREHGDFERGSAAHLFVSQDGGASFSLRAALEYNGVTSIEFGSTPDDLILSCTSGIMWSDDGGRTFHAGTGLPDDVQCDVVRADPHRPGRLLAATWLGPEPFPMYESWDWGRTWELFRRAQDIQISDYPAYLTRVDQLGEMLPTIVFHPTDPDTWVITGFFGVSTTYDNGKSFTGHGFRGTETTCVETIAADPSNGDTVAVTVADHTPWISRDGGKTFVPFPAARDESVGLAFSPHNPGTVVFGVSSLRWNGSPAQLYRSVDHGASMHLIHEFPGRLFLGSICADPHMPGRYWILADGDVPRDHTHPQPGLYRLDGDQLTHVGHPLRIARHLPLEEDWLESQLLTIAVYQKRNAQGCNHMVAVDPHTPGRIFLAEPTHGVWVSEDSGASWRGIDAGLPLGRRRFSTVVHVQPDPAHRDRLYVGFIGEGLWRTDDLGASWQEVLTPATTGEEAVNATGLAICRRTGHLAVPGEPMWWTGTGARLRLSEDEGQTWADILDPQVGGIRLKQAVFDGAGRLHVSTIGNGVYTVTRDGKD